MSKRKNINTNSANEEIQVVSDEDDSKSIEIISEEIQVVSDRDLNFIGGIKFKKDIPISFTKSSFDELINLTPNINKFLKDGVLKIV